MDNKANNIKSRRDFLCLTGSICTLSCLTPFDLFSAEKNTPIIQQNDKHKFFLDSNMSIQDVYNFSFKTWYIPAMKNLMEQVGKQKFLELLKKSSEMLYLSNEEPDIDRSFVAFSESIKQGCRNWKDRLTHEVLNDTDTLLEIKFTECLWAKTFREANASDIGYAGVCFQDYFMTSSFNPKIKLKREKTLMQGDVCCHFKWNIN